MKVYYISPGLVQQNNCFAVEPGNNQSRPDPTLWTYTVFITYSGGHTVGARVERGDSYATASAAKQAMRERVAVLRKQHCV